MRKKQFKRETLENGVTVLVQEKPNMHSVSLGIGVRFGTAHHPLAHFLEHLLFKGSSKRDHYQIVEEIKQWGGYIDGFSQFYSTLFAGKTLSGYACQFLDVLCDMVSNPAFVPQAIELERQVMEHETIMKQGRPELLLRAELYRKLFARHPVRNAIVENLELVKNVDRDKLTQVCQKFYVPERLIVVATGKVNHQNIVKKADKYFGNLSRGIAVPLSIPREPLLKKTKQIVLNSTKTEDCFWMMGFRAPVYTHGDYYTSRVISAILGESINSVLFREIREKKGLTYNIQSYYGPSPLPWDSRLTDDGSAWHGVFRIYSQFHAKDLQLIQDITRAEIERLASKEVDPDELRRKQSMLVGQRLLALEGTLCHLWQLFMAEINNNLDNFEDFENKIFAVNPGAIQRVARKYFSLDKSVEVLMKKD